MPPITRPPDELDTLTRYARKGYNGVRWPFSAKRRLSADPRKFAGRRKRPQSNLVGKVVVLFDETGQALQHDRYRGSSLPGCHRRVLKQFKPLCQQRLSRLIVLAVAGLAMPVPLALAAPAAADAPLPVVSAAAQSAAPTVGDTEIKVRIDSAAVQVAGQRLHPVLLRRFYAG